MRVSSDLFEHVLFKYYFIMKKGLLLIGMLCLMFTASAQSQKEIGMTFKNLDEFGMTFRVGSETSMWRFNALSLGGNKISNNGGDSFGFGLGVGHEFRSSLIEDKLEFRYGLDLMLKMNNMEDATKTKTDMTSFGGAVVLGVNYMLTDHMILGAEILPGVDYVTTEITPNGGTKVESKTATYGLNSTPVTLSIAFRF